MSADVTYRQARAEDIAAIADVYIAAFPESIAHFTGTAPGAAPDLARWGGARRLLADYLALWQQCEPAAFQVAATDEGRIAGYCFAPLDSARLSRAILRRRASWRIALRLLGGRYRLGPRLLGILLGNAWHLLAGNLRPGGPPRCPAVVLSIAVAPEAQGGGIGRALLGRALDSLRAQAAPAVRLEVRPGNAPAIRLYESFGFSPAGRTHDSQGEWLVMLAPLAPPPPP